MSGVRQLARTALWPVRRLLDPRFADVGRRIDFARDRLIDRVTEGSHELEAGQAQLSTLVNTFGAASNESLAFVGRYMRELEAALADVNARLASLEESVAPVFSEQRVERLTSAGVEGLDVPTARLLNFSESHRGFAADRQLWLNPPLSLDYREKQVEQGSVNERIVEIPYAFRALGTLRPPASVLDVGSVESTIPLSLAALGYRVCALDLRAYPFSHPNLEVVVSRIEDFEREPGSFDAVLCISTVEHIGLGWYGEAPQEPDADRRAVERLGDLLSPGGRLVLTVPFGRAAIDDVQRTYDDAGLDALLAGWEIESREVVRQRDARTWVADGEVAPEARAVAMVTAIRPR
jgi:SAM-dependent methyltransferase